MQNTIEMQKGERVALILPNTPHCPVCVFAILLAVLTVVNVNPLYTPKELTHQLNDTRVKTIIFLKNFAHVLKQAIENTSN